MPSDDDNYNLVDQNEQYILGESTDTVDDEFLEQMRKDEIIDQSNGIIEYILESMMNSIGTFIEEFHIFKLFFVRDWNGIDGNTGYGREFLMRYQRMVVVQLSLLVVFAFTRLHLAKEDEPTIFTEAVTMLLIILSVLIVPFAIFICIDFTIFVLITYLTNGFFVRYPEFKNRTLREISVDMDAVDGIDRDSMGVFAMDSSDEEEHKKNDEIGTPSIQTE